MAVKSTTNKAKTKLVNGQRISIATGKPYTDVGSSNSGSSDLMSGITAPLGSAERTKQLLDTGNSALKSLNAKLGQEKIGATGLQETPPPINPEMPEIKPATPITPQTQATPSVSFEQAQKNLQTGGLQGEELAQAETTLKNKYQTGLQQAQSSGLQPPDSMGGARGFIEATVPAGPDTTVVDTVFQEDPFFKEITDAWEDYNSPRKQRDSLTKTYKEMTKASGLEELDTELMNMRNVIDGTEDDIRNEVTKAGGFATDSQVAALTASRNKQLIKNYNNLLETRNIQQQHLDKMIELTEKDRAMADQRLDRMFNIGFQMLNYRDKMQENARNSYQKIVDKVGYSGLLQATGGDPYYINLVERSLGLTSGSLAQLATIKDEEKELNLELKREQIKTEQAQRSKIYADINESGKKKKEAEAAFEKSVRKGVGTAETVFTKVNEAKNKISGKTTGFAGGISRKVPGTSAYELAKTVDTIQANIGFDTLQAMRDASPTGGALGQVSEREIALLQSTVASLDTGLPAETLKQNLDQVAEHYENWLHTVGYSLTPDGKVVRIIDAE